MERRLAALFAADVEAFSRLMGMDETATFETLTSHRAILDGFIAEHRGRIANTAGDSVLAEFPSVVDAVTCALRAQEALASANDELPETRRLQFRIGVHVGDVMVKGGDLFGDGVNIAARLQALSRPGGICLSATAQEYVRKALPVTFEDLGPQPVKNIDEPVRAFAVKATYGQGTPIRTLSAKEILRADRPAVAVLPFTNMGGDPDQVYFSDGITEDIITELARFRELLVIARNSSFSFRGKDVDVREVGRVLNADYVVEGSVRRIGDRVRITGQLINAASGAHLWAERYDRSFEDVFAIQDEIARRVVATVARRIEEEAEAVARRRPPQDMRAYDLFLQGHRLTDVFTDDGQARARAFFERARDLDPTFARAYTGLAFSYLNQAAEEGIGLPRERDPNRIEARRLAEQALTVDPTEPRVQSTAGYVFLTWREFDRAERHLDLAQSMNPNDATIQIFWAWAQACLGNPAKGLMAAELARRLNPRYPQWYNFYEARTLFLLRRYEDVVSRLRYRITGEPTWHRRDMLLLSAAFGLLSQAEPAQRCAGWFLDSVRDVWCGDQNAGAPEYVDWFIDTSYLRRAEDEELLREGLRLAGLPA
ncbi:adenylate/guanylate cyclase domain-containing protein [Microvirga yunnanensis]|uniref:adenylate/guanylate cyclase domain-containing protein n=1 Tax=Microvirga yunnanensis TaxID=2953740 RepID=UPI0021C65108|nr:adenylate/guanylate cyclase domain-containing protein [Microvirga sp. HBU65207]